MNLQVWLDSLENLQHQSAPAAPERCREMLHKLGLDKFCPIITVGGTNGKGSSTYFIAAYAAKMGKKVGRFTSPHLLEYNERIAINGQNASDAEIVAAFEKIKAVQGDLYLGYFDYSFLAAFLIFWQAQVDIMVLEVGLGGRLDATNSVDTDCAIITTIHFDHMHLLGHTREAIGFEKAGIFRSKKLAICGDFETPHSVRDYAKSIAAHFFERGKDFDDFTIKHLPTPHFPIQNAITGIAALRLLAKEHIVPFDEVVLAKVLTELHIPGRMQQLQLQPEIIVDVAHNQESVQYLVDYLRKHPVSGKVLAVFSALQDKNVGDMMALCSQSFDKWYMLELEHPRAAAMEVLMAGIGDFAPAECFKSMDELMAALLAELLKADRVVVFGSFYLANLFLKCYDRNKKNT